MGFSIRELIPENREEDLELLIPAYRNIWNHPNNLRFLSFTGKPFEEVQLRHWCGEHLAAGIRYFAAIDDSADVCGILLTRQNPIEGFELFSIGVRQISKRKGVGSKLVRFGIDVAQQEHYCVVEGQVYANNAPMLCLLLSEEFLPVRMEYNRGPAGEDLVFLRKFLG